MWWLNKMEIKNNKGQVAMEFLFTYGWAILVVLACIGALAYFGVFNPKYHDEFKINEETCEVYCGLLDYDNCSYYGQISGTIECEKYFDVEINNKTFTLQKKDSFKFK